MKAGYGSPAPDKLSNSIPRRHRPTIATRPPLNLTLCRAFVLSTIFNFNNTSFNDLFKLTSGAGCASTSIGLSRYFHTTSICGLCGKTTLEAISVKTKSVWSDLKITPQPLYSLPSFEIMQKAMVARIPIVAAVSAPSSLAVALARKFKMTLVGFLRGENCNIYAGAERIDA